MARSTDQQEDGRGGDQPGEQVYARRGAMLAYTGEVNFQPTRPAGQGVGGFVGRMVAGERCR